MWLGVVVVIVIIAAVWWALTGSSNPSGANNAASSTNAAAANSAGTNAAATGGNSAGGNATSGPFAQPTLSVNTSDGNTLGYHLVASNGMTLYEYNKDSANISACNGACATTWPPYTVTAEQAASLTGGASVNGKIGTLKRADGSLQVTYDNIPLYFYSGDKAAGDANGENLNGFTTIAP